MQLIIIAAALMELCAIDKRRCSIDGIVLCAVDCPKRDSGCSCLRYYKRMTAGGMASLRTTCTVPSYVVCVPVS